MITASATFDTTIQGVDTQVAGTVTIDLPTDVSLSFDTVKVSLNGQMNTPLPDGIRDVAGYSTIGGDITLAGSTDPADESSTIIGYFNPDNPDSPLHQKDINGSKVTFDCTLTLPGDGTESVTRFTGWVNGADLSHSTGEVTLHVVDQDPSWTTSLNLPAVVTDPPYNAGLTSEFVMDTIIRRMTGGASSWPAQRSNCVLAVGLRTSLWPEVGKLDTSVTEPTPTFDTGPMGSGLVEIDTSGQAQAAFYDITFTGNTLFVEFWVSGVATDSHVDVAVGQLSTSGSPSKTTFTNSLQVTASTTDVRIVSSGGLSDFFSTTALASAGPHYVAVAATWNPTPQTWSGTTYVDDSIHTWTGTSGDTANPANFQVAGIIFTGAPLGGSHSFTAAIAGLQITTEASPALNDTFVPSAVLDPSLNPLQVVPAVDAGTAPWDELQTVAAAELGFIRRDESDGTIKFTNRDNLLGQDVGRDITSDESLLDLTTSIPAAATYRTVQVPYTEWEFGSAGLIWQATTRKKIPAWGTLTWTQTVDNLAADLSGTATLLADSASPSDGGTYYRAAKDKFGIANHPGALTVTVTQLSGNQIQIDVDNPWPHDAWLVTPGDTYTDFDAGTPALWVGGIPVTPGDEATVNVVYSDGKGTYQVPSNAYLQDHDTAQAVGQFLIDQVGWAIRDYTGVSIRPDPRIQTGDLDKLVDNKVSGVDEYVLIWGWTLDAEFPPPGSTGTWDMTVDVRALAPPGAWLLGITGRTELGSTTYMYA